MYYFFTAYSWHSETGQQQCCPSQEISVCDICKSKDLSLFSPGTSVTNPLSCDYNVTVPNILIRSYIQRIALKVCNIQILGNFRHG